MNLILFFFIISLILILIIPIKLKANISYNLLKNKGQINIMLYKFTIFSFKLKIKTKYIMLTNKKGKSTLIPISFQDQSNIEYIDLSVVLLNKTTINSIKIDVNIGVMNEPFLTAMLYGLVQGVLSSILCVLKSKKLSVIIENNIRHEYYKDCGTIYIKSGITMCIFDYLWGFALYKLNLKKVGNRYEQTKWRKKSNRSNNGRSNE